MAENSKINWTTHTFNPWIGCTKVSPGCLHCYAETLMDTRYGRVKWGKGNPRSRTAPANWNQVRRWNRTAAAKGERPRVFCASLADWLDAEVPTEWLRDLMALIEATPHLDWLMLTKRPENWQDRISAAQRFAGAAADAHGWILRRTNLWLGTTVEDQQRANERIPALLSIPARIRFLSCEPLLGPVDITPWTDWYNTESGTGAITNTRSLSWVICGGESGPGARPMQTTWAADLRAQCQKSGVAFWMKQMGGTTNSRHETSDLPASLRVRQLPA